MRDRLETDPEFAYKLLVECGLDATIIIGVTLAKRGKRFWKEAEFGGCQVSCGRQLSRYHLRWYMRHASAEVILRHPFALVYAPVQCRSPDTV